MNHREFQYRNKPFAFLPFDIHTGTNKNVEKKLRERGKNMREESASLSLVILTSFYHAAIDHVACN